MIWVPVGPKMLPSSHNYIYMQSRWKLLAAAGKRGTWKASCRRWHLSWLLKEVRDSKKQRSGWRMFQVWWDGVSCSQNSKETIVPGLQSVEGNKAWEELSVVNKRTLPLILKQMELGTEVGHGQPCTWGKSGWQLNGEMIGVGRDTKEADQIEGCYYRPGKRWTGPELGWWLSCVEGRWFIKEMCR